MKYTLEVTFKRPKFRDVSFVREFNMNYTDETYRECENMIRDHLKTIGDDFINEAFYG